MAERQYAENSVAGTVGQYTVSTTLAQAAVTGNLLVAIHRFSTNITNRVIPTGFSENAVESRSTFAGITISSKTAVGGETSFTAGTNAISNVNCAQELVVIELPGPAAFNVASIANVSNVTSISIGPTTTLASGTKYLIGAFGTTAAVTWGNADTTWTTLLDEPDNDRLKVSTKDLTPTTAQSTSQTWTTTAGSYGILASFTYTPVVITTLPWKVGVPLTFATPPGAGGAPQKLSVPMFASQLGADVYGTTATDNISQSSWNQVSDWYTYMHWEGHGWSALRDNDSSWASDKFLLGRNSSHKGSIYINGSYVTQGSPFSTMRMAAHLERNYPLAIACIPTATGMTLSGTINASTTTISITLPSSRPAGLATNHPNGTPSTLWPIIASAGLTPGANIYSSNTANYVAWVRIGDEMIGLPTYSAGNYNLSGGVLTISNVYRGLWSTTAASHTSGARTFTPVYIGSSSGAAGGDAGLSGNPYLNASNTPLRYGVNFWDNARGAQHDGVGFLADQARVELEAMDRNAIKTITAVTGGDTLTSNSHGFTNGQRVGLFGSDIPGGITSLQPYYIVGQTANTFQLATTSGGSAISLTNTNVSDAKVAQYLRSTSVTNTVWWDVTAIYTYNNGDGYGTDMATSSTMDDSPWDFTNSTSGQTNNKTWENRQYAKRAALMNKLSTYGHPNLNADANNYLVNGSRASGGNETQVAGQRWRQTAMSAAYYDGYAMEFFLHEAAYMENMLDQTISMMRGANNTNSIVNAAGNKGIVWAKTNGWKGVDTAATIDRYIRRAYGAWLLAWRTTATEPRFLIRAYGVSGLVTTRPSDNAGRELFWWNFGTPTTQQGGKPTNPNTIDDLYQPQTQLYRRDYTLGVVYVNLGSTARTVTLDANYYDCSTESNRNGILTLYTSGATRTVQPYDSLFLLKES